MRISRTLSLTQHVGNLRKHADVFIVSVVKKGEAMKEDIKTQQMLARIKLDAEGLHSLFNTKLIQGMYDNGSLTPKTILIFVIAAFVIILVVLQLTGTVDVMGMLSGRT